MEARVEFVMLRGAFEFALVWVLVTTLMVLLFLHRTLTELLAVHEAGRAFELMSLRRRG